MFFFKIHICSYLNRVWESDSCCHFLWMTSRAPVPEEYSRVKKKELEHKQAKPKHLIQSHFLKYAATNGVRKLILPRERIMIRKAIWRRRLARKVSVRLRCINILCTPSQAVAHSVPSLFCAWSSNWLLNLPLRESAGNHGIQKSKTVFWEVAES